MAYVDQRTGRNQRVAAITVIALMQGAAIVALVNGLAVHFIQTAPIPNPQATEVPITMPLPIPPPPPPKPQAERKTLPDDPTPHQPLTPTGPSVDSWPIRITPDPVPTQHADPLPPPPLPPTAAPRAARPRNAPGGWATSSDYPSRDLREGNQGVVRFTLAIGGGGKVESCTVTTSSGFPGLDKATCDNVARRARFEPATDGSGKRAAGSYSGSIRWQIPQD